MTWPSFKRSPVRVTVSGTDDRVEAARLRARLVELEATDTDRERALDERYANGLREEKRAALARLVFCESHDPDEHERIDDPFSAQGGDLRNRLSWGQRSAECRSHIEQIGAELERVQVPLAR